MVVRYSHAYFFCIGFNTPNVVTDRIMLSPIPIRAVSVVMLTWFEGNLAYMPNTVMPPQVEKMSTMHIMNEMNLNLRLSITDLRSIIFKSHKMFLVI